MKTQKLSLVALNAQELVTIDGGIVPCYDHSQWLIKAIV
jgi:hypothetical protein